MSPNSARQNYLPSPQVAAQEVLSRRNARQSLVRFTEYTYSRYETGTPHRIIAGQLERVESGEVDRLMLLVAPRHGKSELASRRYPAFTLGRDPRHQVISASATAVLAEDFGRDVRNIIASQEYRNVFPGTVLAQDSQARGKWATSEGGLYYAVGIGGALMGRGATRLIVDDPYATMADALSETTRESVWEWYRGTAYNRLQPGGAIIVICHRMHEDDLCGRLLGQQAAGGDKWEVVELPAIADSGDDQADRKIGQALWPERYPIPALERIKANTLPRHWSALYQQRPAPDEGTFFQRDWFKTWITKPQGLAVYGTSDYAVTDGDGDYTVHRIWGVSPDGDLYRLGGWSGQTTSDVWIDQLLDLIKAFKPLTWFGEAGVIQKAIEPALKRRMQERKVFCRMEWLPSIHDKPTRARGFQARAACGRVWFEQGADLTEYLQFPAGKHDDEVDNASLIGRALDEAHPGIVPAKEQKKARDRWADAFSEDREGADSWKTT